MKDKFKKRWYLFIPLIVAGFVAFGFFTMYLWNWLMPSIFHLPEITFWQTIGLMVLSRLIIGFGSHQARAHHHCRHRIYDKWESMTPEEREQFREHIHMHRPPWVRHREPESKKEE